MEGERTTCLADAVFAREAVLAPRLAGVFDFVVGGKSRDAVVLRGDCGGDDSFFGELAEDGAPTESVSSF